jgi:hypothetical protein
VRTCGSWPDTEPGSTKGLAGHRPNGRMPTMRLAIMLFTRDLRLQDNPALDADTEPRSSKPNAAA